MSIIRRRTKLQKGFTLIELLIVIAIIALLAVLIVASVRHGRTKAHDTRVINDIGQIRLLAEEAYDSAGGTYVGWTSRADATQLDILVDDIEKNNGLPGGAVVMCDGQVLDYCISAPRRSDPSQHYCVDASGEWKQADAPCTCYDMSGPTLACP